MNSELKIRLPEGYATLDLYESEPFPIVKSIIDISEPQSRESAHTLTVKLPGTKNNNAIFSSIFDLNRSVINDTEENFQPDFNPNLKAEAIYYRNGIVQIQGNLQLLKFTVYDNIRAEYEIQIVESLASLFEDIAELKLSEVDLSDFDHLYNLTNIIDSWTAPVGSGYVYPLLEYGLTSNERDYYVDRMFPCVYVKSIVDKIFEQAGYRYDSDFFETDRFKRLIVPYAGKKLRISDEEVTDRSFEANRTTESDPVFIPWFIGGAPVYGPPSLWQPIAIPFDNVVLQSSPPGYDNIASAFQVQTSGVYTFQADIYFRVSNGLPIPIFDGITFALAKYTASTVTVLAQSLQMANEPFNLGQSKEGFVRLTSQEVHFNAGDIVNVTAIGAMTAGLWGLQILPGSTFFNQPSAYVGEGDTVDVGQLLPDDVNQTDFLSSLIKMFNLYCEPDQTDPKKLLIEPRDDFYTDDIVDLTPNVDVESIEVLPMGALQFKSYNYTYQPDEDISNRQHQDKYNDPYGNRRFKVQNDFVTEENTTELIFAPTPLRDTPSLHTRVVSKIWFVDENGERTDSVAKMRILYYGGVITPPNPEPWFLRSRSGPSFQYDSYPYAGHLDSISNPQFDLSFGYPQEVQYFASKYTDNNLFNIYHKKGITEIVDPDSKIITCKLRLTEVELNELSFRPFYFIDQQFYRLYNFEYDGNSGSLVTAQFLKLRTGPIFTPTQSDINGGLQGTLPIWMRKSARNDNGTEKGPDIIVLGQGNQVGNADSVMMNSNGNTVGADQCTCLGGEENQFNHAGVTMLNSENYQSTIENEMVMNNIQQPFFCASAFTAYDVSGIDGSPVVMIPSKYGYWTEVVAVYAALSFFGETPIGFNSTSLKVEYETGGTIAEFDSAFTAGEVAARKTGEIILFDQKSDNVILTADAALGSSGNGVLRIDIHYRLIPYIP